MDRSAAVEALVGLGVSRQALNELPELRPDIRGLLLFGSQARGDAVEGSDVDLLALVPRAEPTRNSGEASISYYTIDQLESGIGTLFGAHLRRDSKVLWDPDNLIGGALARMGDVDTGRLFRRAREMSQLFTTLDYDLPKYLPGLLRQARYLLRSCLYARAIMEGRPCFSVREIAIRERDERLVSLLSSDQSIVPNERDLADCVQRLSQLIGKLPESRNGSLEATIVNEWEQGGDLLSMAFICLGKTPGVSGYSEVETILL